MATVEIETVSGSISAYRAEPQGEVAGAVVLIHEVWGLVPHIIDVADRLASEGYLVVAPDILSHAGVDPEIGAELQRLMFSADDAERAEAQPRMREALSTANSPEYAEWAVGALTGVVDHLEGQLERMASVAVVGFCFGGSYAWALAAADPRVRLTVPFYGSPPEHAELGSVQGRVLAFYGETDDRVTSTLAATADALEETGTEFASVVYPGVGHAFFNDTNPVTYDEAAATDAWAKLLAELAR